MNTPRRTVPDAAWRIAAWSLVIPVALAAFAPDWLYLMDGEFERLVTLLVYLPLGIGATLWAATTLRPSLGVVIEDAFGRRSDLADAASGCTTTTFALFGLAFATLNAPTETRWGESLWSLASQRLGWLFVMLGATALTITLRSVKRRNERDLHRRIVARAREEVKKDLNGVLATEPPRVVSTPTAW